MSKRKSGKSTTDKDIVDAEIVTPETEASADGTDTPEAAETPDPAPIAEAADKTDDAVVTPEPTETKDVSEGDTDADAAKPDADGPTDPENAETEHSAGEGAETVSDDGTKDTDASPEGTDVASDDDLSEKSDTTVETANREEAAAKPDPAPQVIRETTIEKKAGFVPTLLGGVLAAAAGFGLAQVLGPDMLSGRSTEPDPVQVELQQRLDALSGQVTTLTGAVDSLASQEVDLSPVTDQLSALSQAQSDLSAGQTSATETLGALSATATALETALSELTARVDTLEQSPIAETVPEEAVAAYERALDALRQEIDTQRNELRAEIDAQRSEVARMVEEAAAAEQAASAQAGLAEARAAMAQIVAALEAGTGFDDALSTLSESAPADVPAALVGVSDGVPTQAELAASFPPLARDALAAARTGGGEGGESGLGNFLRAQLGVRSLEPQEGDDPDAVLSRAEAAVRTGDLATALTEIATLPAPAQEVLADWTAQAQTRQAALTAAAELGQALNAE